jgi:hypothetical protein
MTKQATAFKTVTANLFSLNQSELQEVADMVKGLLEALEDEDAQVVDQVKADVNGNGQPAKRAARGHVEAKVISGCGPYLYLRYWSGGHLRSKYIGKAKKE